jgi:hypothetical protein
LMATLVCNALPRVRGISSLALPDQGPRPWTRRFEAEREDTAALFFGGAEVAWPGLRDPPLVPIMSAAEGPAAVAASPPPADRDPGCVKTLRLL